MNIAATIALSSALLSVYVAVLALRFSVAPGWTDQRWFGLVAVTVAAYATLDIAATASVPVGVAVWCSRFQLFLAGIHIYAWIRYSDVHIGIRASRLRGWLSGLPLGLGALALVPRVVFDDAVRIHAFAPLGLVYRDTVVTPFGTATFALQLLCFLALIGRYLRAWRCGVRHAVVHVLALGFLTLIVANDALVSAGMVAMPYLIVLGFIVPVAAVAYSMTARFTGDAQALADLRGHLERQVEERTLALSRTQAQLHRAEKLAAVGSLAAGVAHEVSSPAAAAAANLRYVMDSHDANGHWPDDTQDSLCDSLASIGRIARITRQLLDAGRLAGAQVTARSVRLLDVAQAGARIAEAQGDGSIRIVLDVDPELHGLGQEEVLVQVLVNLVVNGIQAIPEGRTDGRVVIRGDRTAERARLIIEDNGVGMTPEVLQRAFDPFFTTKAFGKGTGLGLAVSRGLLQGLGGEVFLESAVGHGSRAIVELPMIARGSPSASPAIPAGLPEATG
jgi:signal transduction histidine kinase